ncbi:nitric oxide synthase oxygenase [Dictyobacter arantiisoli]|uniref:Nitric oxide synthase oxygenase n=1 Tax=Dictyobacter arantiisoli TaxID=2014874 RepID=A0A5A5THB7_9CHLR|nr:nitric oxide synthase oxygenase [Dictyobacter arantiisoli]GCF10364.1 nitric oxide synthase oxygenase [Dictyobacter arantiisoli]
MSDRHLFLPQNYDYISFEDVAEYYLQYQQELGLPIKDIELRLEHIQEEIRRSGTYDQTYNEVSVGTKLAWKHAIRCIGRLHWNSLEVRDLRHLSHSDDIFQALIEHIELSTNGGKIKPFITLFAPQELGKPGIRIWNTQLIRYAGYQNADGTILGDPAEVNFTRFALELGWKPEKTQRTAFDILPLILQLPGQKPQLFNLPPDIVLEVPIIHPEYQWFADLDLKWYAFPAISNMCLEIGGIRYTAAPFSGWYLVTEIGARNFGDVNRYNFLPKIAAKMGLNTNSDRSLWKDQALVELNRALLYSYTQKKVTMIDHHTATRQFVLHEEQEKKAGRQVHADWKWIVPPMSGSTTPVYHRNYESIQLKPNWFYQSNTWEEYALPIGG